MTQELQPQSPKPEISTAKKLEQVLGPVLRMPNVERVIFKRRRELVDSLADSAAFIKDVLGTTSFKETDRVILGQGIKRASRELRIGEYSFHPPQKHLDQYILAGPRAAIEQVDFYVLKCLDSLVRGESPEVVGQYETLKREAVLTSLGEVDSLATDPETQASIIEGKIGEFREKAQAWLAKRRILGILSHDAPTTIKLQGKDYKAYIKWGNGLGAYSTTSYFENLTAYGRDFMSDEGRKVLKVAVDKGFLSVEELGKAQRVLAEHWEKLGHKIAEAVRADGIDAKHQTDIEILNVKTTNGEPFYKSYGVEDCLQILKLFPKSQENIGITQYEVKQWTQKLEEKRKKQDEGYKKR